MKVLIVEDEVELCSSMVQYLSSEHYQCDVAHDADEAREKTEISLYDCIILDVMLPFGSGMLLLEELKTLGKKAGFLIISAKDSIDDRLKALNLGADDYLTKPFHLAELSDRLQSIIHKRNSDDSKLIIYKNLTFNLDLNEVKIVDELIDLKPTESAILLFLLRNKSKVVSKNALAENLSKHAALYFDNFDVIKSHINNLKTKLGPIGDSIKIIYDTGYKLE